MSLGTSYTRSKLACAVVAVMLIMTQSLFAQGSGTLKRTRAGQRERRGTRRAQTPWSSSTNLGAAADIDGKFTYSRYSRRESYDEGLTTSGIDDDHRSHDSETMRRQTQEIRLTAASVIGETVIVTAQAKGQLSSINQELASTSIINVVSAEKMKELPDANIAESIGRLPGISLQRDAGEANAVIIRGLSPKYNEITIEGVPMSSTYFGDRGVDLSLVGDDLVKGVEVSKTLRPDMDADALGGTVNLTLKTAQPGLHYDVWGNGGYTKLNDSYNNYKFSGSAGDRFVDDKFGVLIQGNIEEKQLPSNQLSASYATPIYNKAVNQFYVNTQQTDLTESNTTRHRYGASAILDYASDFVDVKLFNVYDQKSDSNISRGNITSFSSTQFQDQVFVSRTRTEQRSHSLQALFKFAGTELPISLCTQKPTKAPPLYTNLTSSKQTYRPRRKEMFLCTALRCLW